MIDGIERILRCMLFVLLVFILLLLVLAFYAGRCSASNDVHFQSPIKVESKHE